MRVFLICVISLILWSSCSVNKHQNDDKAAILQVLKKQELAWNSGNLDVFMEGYWKSDSLIFIGKSGVKYGWETTLNNYKKSYPTTEIMGKLSFDVEKIEIINKHMAFIVGKYTLIRKEDTPSGYFTLIWKKIGGQWYITSDHTSG